MIALKIIESTVSTDKYPTKRHGPMQSGHHYQFIEYDLS
jgi:hypothetical protein